MFKALSILRGLLPVQRLRLLIEALTARWWRDVEGTVAVEFGLVGLPLVFLLFGVVAVGLHCFTTFSLENAVERAGRLIRTGQAQAQGMTAAQFKQEVCERTTAFADCAEKLRVNVQSSSKFATLSAPSCVDTGGNLVPPAATVYNPGVASALVLVTVCYEWDFAARIPFVSGSMANGAMLIQAATAFRTEPYKE